MWIVRKDGLRIQALLLQICLFRWSIWLWLVAEVAVVLEVAVALVVILSLQ